MIAGTILVLFITASPFLEHSIPQDSMKEKREDEREWKRKEGRKKVKGKGGRGGGRMKGSFEFKYFFPSVD